MWKRNATYNWFPAINSLDTIQSNNSVGLSKDITGRIFAPTDPRNTPTADLAAGAVMPYFALGALPFSMVPKSSWSDHRARSTLPGCYENSWP